MPKPFSLSIGLHETLLKVLSIPTALPEISHLVQVCHALALSTLKQRLSGRYAGELQGISPSQLAYDCIADLFARDHENRLVKIDSYFQAFEPQRLSDEQVLQHLRRLVAGTVQQGLFRVYGEVDPTLGRILRNVKLAVQSLGHFRQIDHFGESCLAPALCDSLEHLSPCPLEELERGVLLNAARSHTVPDLLSALSVYLRGQSEYSRVVPMIDVARVFRIVFSRISLADTPIPAETDNAMVQMDLDATISWACETVKARMVKSYVGKGRICEETLAMYQTTIHRYLRAKLDGEGERASLREQFMSLHPDIPKGEYKSHRSRLEYMTRMAERLIFDRIRK